MGVVDHESHFSYDAADNTVVLGHANELTGTLGHEGEMVRALFFD